MSAGEKRVLLTGARGFIGRRCLPALAARGFEVHAVSSSAQSGGAAQWHRCELRDGAAAAALVERVRPTHLLHLAWIAQSGIFWTSPDNHAWLAAGQRMVEAFYGAGGLRAVGVGSCAEYADSSADCGEDSTPIAPGTPYGEAKAAMCAALRSAAGGRGTWAWARLFSPYGAGEPAGRFIPSVIDGLLRGVPVDCTHGAQVRDFVHADDVAEACVALVAGASSGAYNVGTGQGSSLREVAAAIVAELGRGELLRFGARPAPANEPARVVANMDKMRREVGWQPRVTLAAGLHGAIAAQRAKAEGNT